MQLALRKRLQDERERAAIFARLWSLVHRTTADECWEFIGPKWDHGYGMFNVSVDGRNCRVRAHRFAWEASRGDIPAGMEVCHRCDLPACVNPNHLFLGSRRDNHLDAVRKGRKRVFGRQKLKAADVLDIRRRAAAGERHQTLADAYGLARHSISGIVHRKSWAHLPDASSVFV